MRSALKDSTDIQFAVSSGQLGGKTAQSLAPAHWGEGTAEGGEWG